MHMNSHRQQDFHETLVRRSTCWLMAPFLTRLIRLAFTRCRPPCRKGKGCWLVLEHSPGRQGVQRSGLTAPKPGVCK